MVVDARIVDVEIRLPKAPKIDAQVVDVEITLPEPSRIDARIVDVEIKIEEGEEPDWWRRLLDLLVDNPLIKILTSSPFFAIGYQLATGREMDLEEYLRHELEIADWILPINAISKLLTGTNIQGEPEEFGGFEDWADIVLTAAAVVPAGKIPELALKLGAGKITAPEAVRLVNRFTELKVIDELVNIVRKHPAKNIDLLVKFPPAVRNAVIDALNQSKQGRGALVILGGLGYFNKSAPAIKRAIKGIFTASALVLLVTLPIFATTEIPNAILFWKNSKKNALQILGNYPPDISFQLNEFSGLLENIMYDTDRAIRDDQFELADQRLQLLIKSLEDYSKYIDEKKEFMLPEDFDVSTAEIEFYNIFVDDRRIRIDEGIKGIGEPGLGLGTLEIVVDPDDADIFVAGQPEITKPGSYQLQEGTYDIRASRDGFVPEERTVFLNVDELKVVSILLEREIKDPPPIEKGRIEVSSTPTGAKIFIDDKFTFEFTNTSVLVEPGLRKLTIKKEGFEDFTTSFNIAEKETKIFNIEMIEIPGEPPGPEPVEVRITSDPIEADIYINGEYKFVKTPFTTLLEPGEYIFRVQKDGFFASELRTEIKEGEPIQIDFVLEEIPPGEDPFDPYDPFGEWPPDTPANVSGNEIITGIPVEELGVIDFNLLDPVFQLPIPFLAPLPSIQKEVVINIETTDLLPWKGRLFSIAWKDLSEPESEIKVITDIDERGVIMAFIEEFEKARFTQIVGFKVSFDYRYIFDKMMLYRIQSKIYANAKLRDVKQILDQVKEEFIYMPDKKGTLDDYGKHLLGRGKLVEQEVVLRKFLEGDFDFVSVFNINQIEITKGLYDLARFSLVEGCTQTPRPNPGNPEPVEMPIMQEMPKMPGRKACKNCLQVNPMDARECLVCGDAI